MRSLTIPGSFLVLLSLDVLWMASWMTLWTICHHVYRRSWIGPVAELLGPSPPGRPCSGWSKSSGHCCQLPLALGKLLQKGVPCLSPDHWVVQETCKDYHYKDHMEASLLRGFDKLNSLHDLWCWRFLQWLMVNKIETVICAPSIFNHPRRGDGGSALLLHRAEGSQVVFSWSHMSGHIWYHHIFPDLLKCTTSRNMSCIVALVGIFIII